MWQPIKTAPRDGTPVDLWVDGKRFTDCTFGPFAQLSERWSQRIHGGRYLVYGEPTHWMPIPAAPGSPLQQTTEEKPNG